MGGRGFIVPGVSSGDPRNWEREYESFRIVPLFLFQNCENGMCTRNVDCALCSTFQGKSLKECKQSGKCEENVLEVQIVDDIKKKTGKNGLSQRFFFFFTRRFVKNNSPNWRSITDARVNNGCFM